MGSVDKDEQCKDSLNAHYNFMVKISHWFYVSQISLSCYQEVLKNHQTPIICASKSNDFELVGKYEQSKDSLNAHYNFMVKIRHWFSVSQISLSWSFKNHQTPIICASKANDFEIIPPFIQMEKLSKLCAVYMVAVRLRNFF